MSAPRPPARPPEAIARERALIAAGADSVLRLSGPILLSRRRALGQLPPKLDERPLHEHSHFQSLARKERSLASVRESLLGQFVGGKPVSMSLFLRSSELAQLRGCDGVGEEQLEKPDVADLRRVGDRLAHPLRKRLATAPGDRVEPSSPPLLFSLLFEQAKSDQPRRLGIELRVGEGPEIADRSFDPLLKLVGRLRSARDQAEELEVSELIERIRRSVLT